MKKIILAILLLAGIQSSYAQNLAQVDCDKLNPLVKSENWKMAFKESAKLLKEAESDTSDFHAIVLYINVISAAGMVTQGQMSYKDLAKNVSKHEGQKIIAPSRPVTMRDGAFGETKFSVSDSTYEAFTSVANSKKLNILSFEKFIMKDKINIYDLQQSNVLCGGILQKAEINPSLSISWVLRLTIKEAFVRKS